MPAYSFGARWVGVVALHEAPQPEPLHKMALRLRQAPHAQDVQVSGLEISADKLSRVLARIRIRQGLAGQAARAAECLRVEQMIRAGRTPALRSWLRAEVVAAQGGNLVPRAAASQARGLSNASRATKTPKGGIEPIVATGWATSYPQAADSPWLPPLREPFAQAIGRLGLKLDDHAERWVRWGCLHSSYLRESVPDSPISAGVLEVLAMLGRGWMRLALLERARGQRGEFASNNEVTAVLAADQQARDALRAWSYSLGAGFYGKGEASLLDAGRRSRAPEAVAMQILGALSLVTASQAAADALLDAIGYSAPKAEPDWMKLLLSQVKLEPQFERTEEGPDHNRTFTVTVSAAGRAASASAGSAKAARTAALREYVTRYLPRAIPNSVPAIIFPKPRAYLIDLPRHSRAVEWARQAFEVADAGLIAQALTHRSWVYENASLVSAAGQRDYGTLATEGSEILTHLVRHHHAIQLLAASFQVPTGAVTSPSVTGAVVSQLFDSMPIAAGVLRSRGLRSDTELPTDLKEDVAQAIAAAAWRANGDLMAERQPAMLASWIRSFTPAVDATTQLQEYCARVKVAFSFDFDLRGPDHAREYSSILTFEVEGRPTWRGEWSKAKVAAKHSAAAGALGYLLGDEQDGAGRAEDGAAIVQGVLLAELRAISPEMTSFQRELANGTLGVDLLASGDYAAYDDWGKFRRTLLPADGSGFANRLTQFYEAVLIGRRRDAIRQWIVRHTSARGLESTEAADRLRDWWVGSDPARLVLLDDLLPKLRNPNPTTAIVDYIVNIAKAVATAAGSELELDRTDGQVAHTVTMRVDGLDLPELFDPVVQLVEAAGTGATWTRESQALSVTIPRLAALKHPLSSPAIVAVNRALNDPWLDKVGALLSDFLVKTESAFGTDGEPLPANLEELSLAELSLILHLRSNGEEDL